MESEAPPPSTHRHRVDPAALAAAFRRFKDALAGYPELCERWFAVKGGRLCVRVRDWLAAGIAPIKEGN